jgi:hypothetical protein
MSWLVALAGLSLAGALENEETVVLVSRRTATSPVATKVLAQDTSRLLEAQGVPLAMAPDAALQQLARVSVKDSASCNGKRACLAELGRQLKVAWVVTLSVATIDNELSLGFELLKVSDESVAETDSLLLPRKGKLAAAQLGAFAQRVKARLVPTPPEPLEEKRDAPVATDLTPKPNPDLPPVSSEPPAPPPPPSRSRVPSFVLGGTGLASLLAGAALLTVGLVSRGALTAGMPGTDGRVRSSLTYTEAMQVNGTSNALVFSGLGALVLGAGLGTAAVLTW